MQRRKAREGKESDESIQTPEEPPRNKSEKRASIWDQRDIDRRFSEMHSPSVQMFIEQSRCDDFKPLHSKEVYLFDIVESRDRNRVLQKRFAMYVPQSYFGNKLRSTTLKHKTTNSFYDIVYLYEQFAVANADEERKVMPQSYNFESEHLQTLFFTIPENYTVEADKISGETSWLKLMSWWKFFNQSFVPCCQELHTCLTTNTEKNQSIFQLRNALNDSLRKLNLIGFPAEIAIMKMYVEFSSILLDIEAWYVSRENAMKGFQKDCFQNVSCDSLWRHFLKECTHYSLSLLCNVMKFMSENGFDANNIGTIMENDIENFASELIKQYSAEESEEDYVSRLKEITLKKIDKFFTEINIRKNDGGCNVTTVIYLCCQMLSSLMKVTVRTFEHLFGDSHAVTSQKALSKYLLNTVINGSIVADKALQNDSFLSRNLLLQLIDEEMHASTTDLSIDRSLKFAYILTVSYQIINEHNAAMVLLPSNYIQHDFVSFLNDIERELDIIPQSERSTIEFSLEMKMFQDELLHELGKSLSNINNAANSAKILLNK